MTTPIVRGLEVAATLMSHRDGKAYLIDALRVGRAPTKLTFGLAIPLEG
jgi:hypothetical protein